MLLARPYSYFEWLRLERSPVLGALAVSLFSLALPLNVFAVIALFKGAPGSDVLRIYGLFAKYVVPLWIGFMLLRACLIVPIALLSMAATKRHTGTLGGSAYAAFQRSLTADSPTHLPIILVFTLWLLVLGGFLSVDFSRSDPEAIQRAFLYVAVSVTVLLVIGRVWGAWAAARGLRVLCGLNSGLGLLSLYFVDLFSVLIAALLLIHAAR